MVYMVRYGNKYGAKKTTYNGRRYDSKLEARVAYELDMRMKSGEFTEIIPQYRIKLYVYLPDGKRADLFTYVCDFRCQKADGSYLLIEAKGKETEVYRVKKRILDLVWLPDHLDYEYEVIK